MTRKHFEAAAALIKRIPAEHRSWTFEAFAEIFRENPRFDEERFAKACGWTIDDEDRGVWR